MIRTIKRNWILTCAAAAAFIPAIASAQVHDLGGGRNSPGRSIDRSPVVRRDVDRRDADRRDVDTRNYDRGDNRRDYDRNDRSDFRIDVGFGNPTPSYERAVERIWIAPVYQTVCERVWIAPIVQDVSERVWVAPGYEIREVVRHDGWRRVITRERVLVSPGHWKNRTRQLVVREGRWETVERQVLVSAGHWEERPIVYAPRPTGLNFLFGYSGR